jgi:signal transduction histidine kinase/ligand-binding sensor domain-containing protein
MQTWRLVAFIIHLSLLPFLSASQDILVKVIQVEDGLSQSSVNSITQDPAGVIWISTGDGLNSYDGNVIKPYYANRFNHANQTTFCNSFRSVLPDQDGNLWVGSDRGILFLDRQKDSLYLINDTNSVLKDQSCLPLFLSDSIFILTHAKGILSSPKENIAFRLSKYTDPISHLNISIIDKNEIWFGSFPNRINRIYLSQNRLKHQVLQLNEAHLGMVCQILQLEPNRYLLVNGDKLFVINTEEENISEVEMDFVEIKNFNTNFKAATIDWQGNIWLGNEDGSFYVLDKQFKLKNRVQLVKNLANPNSPFRNLMCLFSDSFGNIWAGSDGHGIAVFRPEQLDFNPQTQIKLNQTNIEKPFIRAFAEDQLGNLWIGTYKDGLFIQNQKNGFFRQIRIDSKLSFPNHNDIYSICPFGKNQVLIGTSSGLLAINCDDYSIHPILGQSDQTMIQKVHQISILNQFEIAVLINKQLRIFVYHAQKWEEDSQFTENSLHYDFIFQHNDELIAFSKNEFLIHTDHSNSLLPYRYQGKLISLDVNAALYDLNRNAFWICGESGLILLDLNGNVQKWIGMNEGLPNHYLYGILQDENGNLWISSNGGLSRFNPSSGEINNFGLSDGLQSLEFNTGAFYQSKNGNFYFGGINGYNSFNPNSIHNLRQSAPILLKKVLINDENWPFQFSDIENQGITLDYDQNTITFEFQGLDYLNGSHMKYLYQLESWDQEWVHANNKSQVRYSKLPAGSYLFKVRDARFPADPSKILEVKFVILKPFWEKRAFQIPALIFLISFIYLISRSISTYSMRKRIALLEQQKAIHTIKSKIASDLHDDIGAGLSKLAMISEAAGMNENNDSRTQLLNITQKTRQMIDQLRMIVWTLDPPDEGLDELIAYLRTKTGDFMDQLEMEFHFSAPESTQVRLVTAEFRRNVYYVIREAIHNALKHAHCSRIDLKISLKSQDLLIEICDNGVGFNPSATNNKGYGLKGMAKRIAELNGQLTVESNIGRGTKLVLLLPIEITT